jgi:hypothetical protein
MQPLASPRPHVSLCLWVTQLLYNYHSRQLFHFVVLCLWMIKVWELSPVDSEQVQSQTLQNRNALHSLQHTDSDSGNFRIFSSPQNWLWICLRLSRLFYPRVWHRLVFWANIYVSKEHVAAIFSVEVYRFINMFYCRRVEKLQIWYWWDPKRGVPSCAPSPWAPWVCSYVDLMEPIPKPTHFKPEDGASMFLRNICIRTQNYAVSQTRRSQS